MYVEHHKTMFYLIYTQYLTYIQCFQDLRLDTCNTYTQRLV